LPHHVANLLILLVLAYVWMIALGSQAVAAGCSQPLIRPASHAHRRHWSLFREGLRYFDEFVQRHTRCLGFTFIPDSRFTWNMSTPEPTRGEGTRDGGLVRQRLAPD